VGASAPGAYLIVNADDYGYFRCVSRASSRPPHAALLQRPAFSPMRRIFASTRVAPRLPGSGCRQSPEPDVRRSAYQRLPQKAVAMVGTFPGEVRSPRASLRKPSAPKTSEANGGPRSTAASNVACAWRFLNSHEHVHVLPALLTIAIDLAANMAIAHVRIPSSRLAWNSQRRSSKRSPENPQYRLSPWRS